MNTSTSNSILLLAVPADRTALASYFNRQGWTPIPDLPDPDQQPDDDQLLALWQSPDGASAELVTDGFIHWLEFRDAEKSVRDTAAQTLVSLNTDAVSDLLAHTETKEIIAGIRAARLLEDLTLAPALAALHNHPDESVRTEASWALQAMLPHLIDSGMRLFRERARRQNNANPLWDLLEPAWFRRQTLRWLLRDHPQPTPGVESTLRAALTDSDWEVRAGALIGAVRYRLSSLGGLVEKCPLPHVSRNGPDAPDRALLRELKRVGCALLAGRVPPPLAEDASAKAQVLDRLAQLLTSSTHTPDDHAGLLVHALTTPVDPGTNPVPPPRGVTEDEDGPHLDELRLAAVPLVAAWLGDGEGLPIRQIRGGGFFIAEQPIAGGSTPLDVDAAAVLDWCRRNADRGLRLPAVDEWEIAMRGNDGRRFPWGNGFQEDSPVTPGPWGTWGHSAVPEWALAPDGTLLRCGSGCAERRHGEGLARIRPVVG